MSNGENEWEHSGFLGSDSVCFYIHFSTFKDVTPKVLETCVGITSNVFNLDERRVNKIVADAAIDVPMVEVMSCSSEYARACMAKGNARILKKIRGTGPVGFCFGTLSFAQHGNDQLRAHESHGVVSRAHRFEARPMRLLH